MTRAHDAASAHADARALEQAGRLLEAAHAYVAAGEVEAGARVLANLGRWLDASRLLLSLAGSDPMRDANTRRLTYHAATCLAHGGDHAGAACLLRAIGADVPAATSPARPAAAPPSAPPAATSPLEAAAHQARAAGQPADAALLFQRAARPFEAGVCFFEAGQFESALAHLITVPAASARYRSACLRVIHIAASTGVLSFEVDNFISSFGRSDPTSTHEVNALYTLGVLYERNGFDDEAREAFERVVRADPGHREAGARLGALLVKPEKANYAALAEQDLSFWAPTRRAAPDDDESGTVTNANHGARKPESARPAAASGPRLGLSALEPGSVIAGRYVVEREVGRGGMGVVYAARDTDLQEVVALKAFSVRADDPILVARFKQELTLSRQLTHENVVRLHDMGVDQGWRFITMELLKGDSLKAKMKGLTLPVALGYLSQICSGLGAIHARGVVHRDIKPANVFVTDGDVVKIMDFGLAKKQDAPEGITVSGFMAGTPGYMPPEQITSFGSVTAAADLYALGALAYEITTGVRPFSHQDPSQLFRLQFTTDPKAPSERNPVIPRELDALVLRLLDRDPTRRPEITETHAIVRSLLPADR